MNTSVLSLVVAILAVFIGPIAKRQIQASAALAHEQIRFSIETSSKQVIAPISQAWVNDLRDLLAELTSSALHYYVAGFEERTDKEYLLLTLLEHKIVLTLDAGSEIHRSLEKCIRKMVEEINYEKGSRDEFPELHKEVVSLSREILQREWEHVKAPIQPANVLVNG